MHDQSLHDPSEWTICPTCRRIIPIEEFRIFFFLLQTLNLLFTATFHIALWQRHHWINPIPTFLSVLMLTLPRPETDPNRKNRGEWTPLMYASYIGHDNVVNLLLEAKVDVNISTVSGTTPLMLAASCGNESVACFLHQVISETRNWKICYQLRKRRSDVNFQIESPS